MGDGRHVTLVEIDDPPGYFQVSRTGRVHLVLGVTRVTRPDGATHLTVRFWCWNMATDRTGKLLTVMPPDALECVGCQQVRDRGLPRGQP